MAAFTTLISVQELAERLDDCVVVDCRHDLARPEAGLAAYQAGHLPGAHFLHLDRELSGPLTGRNGRHPLPDPQVLSARLDDLGLAPGRQLVAYDSDGGMTAARLWWMARWLGHPEAAVLDGGLPAWIAAGLPVSVDEPKPPARPATRHARAAAGPDQTPRRVDAAALLANIDKPRWLVVDARAAERYRGEIEPIDARAGHIPGAINRPFKHNLRDDGRFKPGPVLRAEFESLIPGRRPEELVHSCGSGVTACHNLLAMAHAGLDGGALYPGSWSEWSADSSRPIETGDRSV